MTVVNQRNEHIHI